MTKLLLIIFSVLTGYNSISQTIIPRFESLGVNEGLPHSSVYSILQDKKGFMWFGTADGLCRYDGGELKTFKYTAHYDNDEVNNFVRGKMLEDKTGNIWYCNESGIYKWDALKEVVTREKSFDKKRFKNADFQSIYLDAKNGMWLFNYMHGIFEFNILTGSFTQHVLPLINNSTVVLTYVTVDKTGNFWIKTGTQTDPFILFNSQSHKYSFQFTDNPPQAIFFGKKNPVLAYEDKLVYTGDKNKPAVTIPKIINGKKVSFYSFDGLNDKFGRLWMTARGNGLFYYDENNHTFHEYHHDNSKIKSLPFDLTTCLFIDRNENLWIGIDGGGIAKLDLKQPKFNLYPLSEGDFPILNDYFTKCFYEDEKGRIWFGSQTNGLNIFDPQLQALTNYHYESDNPNSLPGNMVGSIIKDKDGNIWVGSSGGFSIFNEKEKSFKTIPIQGNLKLYPLLNNLVYKMVQTEDGNFVAATILGIIKIVKEKNGEFKAYHFPDNRYLSSVTTDILEMPGKIFYATVPAQGLYQLEQSGKQYKFINSYFNGIDLRSVKKDESHPGYLWICSGKGLIHFNTITHAYKIYDEKDGLSNSYVYGCLEDSTGNLWISTNKGLSFYNRQENKFKNYSFQDGLQSNEFNTQAFYKSSSGHFYFGGIKGFNWFKPGYDSKEYLKPVAAITSIQINDIFFQKDSAYLFNKTITVPHNKNDFSFKFAALDYTRPEANNIQYMLQGWDAGWVAADNKSARYANLSPGNYILKLKVSNANGTWSDEESINIIIRLPFWKQTWFLSIAFLLLFLAIVLATNSISQQKAKRKLRLLEKQIAIDAERNRISADMHDEIGSGITHIALLSELIQTRHKEETQLKKDINIIATSARKLVQTMSDIIWALNPQNDTLENLLAYIREQSQQYFEPLEMKFAIDFPDAVLDIKLSNAERRNLYLVTKEALNNAMKHSACTAVKLKVEITKKLLHFSVSDNGKGMNEKCKHGSNGIRNMKKRMEDINGTIEWLPLKKGTTVKYCLAV